MLQVSQQHLEATLGGFVVHQFDGDLTEIIENGHVKKMLMTQFVAGSNAAV